jgi:Reverse transcriptase (RNA-dependent DNA polymerase)
MVNSNVWTAVDKDTLDTQAKILTTTWAMKKKTSGKFRARMNARGFEQVDRIHYNSTHTAAPITNDTTIRIMYTLAAMAKWSAYVVDINGAFLNGRFEKGETLYLKIPEGFEKYYKLLQVLKLNRTIYGLKQLAQAFWSELLKAMKAMGLIEATEILAVISKLLKID